MGRPKKQGSEEARMVAAQFSSEQFALLERAASLNDLTPNEFMRTAALDRAVCIQNFHGSDNLPQEADRLAKLILRQVHLGVDRHLGQMTPEGRLGAVQALIHSKGDLELLGPVKTWSKEKTEETLRAEVVNRRIEIIANALRAGGGSFVVALIKHLEEGQSPGVGKA
jgi:hypothetical protein